MPSQRQQKWFKHGGSEIKLASQVEVTIVTSHRGGADSNCCAPIPQGKLATPSGSNIASSRSCERRCLGVAGSGMDIFG